LKEVRMKDFSLLREKVLKDFSLQREKGPGQGNCPQLEGRQTILFGSHLVNRQSRTFQGTFCGFSFVEKQVTPG
ncbi:hypothetical protein ACQP3F_25915, partial [Escherichia coli]